MIHINIKPIKTFYNGYVFRSKLEATWAVFFDSLDIKYDYEIQGFQLGGDAISREIKYYRPDFYLPDYGYWIEIKSRGKITHEELVKIHEFNRRTEGNFYLLIGNPYPKEYIGEIVTDSENHMRWGKCPITNRLDLFVDGRWGTESIDCNECKTKSDCIAYNSADGLLIDTGRYHGGACFPRNGVSIFEDSKIMKAYSRARAKSFDNYENI